uniref:Uncharacterized protein n=1 Tax=viral metagenome TaxID=1070528 RepID=A0A6C0HW78_9ZZZZ
MESTISYMSYFISNTPSDITNEFFITIPIYELVGSKNTMVNEHIDKHIMYYINNHLFLNNEISSYLLNHNLYKDSCMDKIDEISDMLADRFFEISEGKTIEMFAPEYENKVFSIVECEISNSFLFHSSPFMFSICNFQPAIPSLYMHRPEGKLTFIQNNRDTVGKNISNAIIEVMSMRDDNIDLTRNLNIKNAVTIKLHKKTYNGTKALLHDPPTVIIEPIILIN